MHFKSMFISRRAVAGLALVSALAAAPAAQAAVVGGTADATGTLTGSDITTVAPSIDAFSAALTGVTHPEYANVNSWSVTDARGTNEGYNVTVSADAPTVDVDNAGAGAPSTAAAGTNPTVSLTTSGDGTNTDGLTAGPTSPTGYQLLGTTAASVARAASDNGMGLWTFDGTTATNELKLMIPGDARAGTFATKLTFTTSAYAL
jgi:hypothetical protein